MAERGETTRTQSMRNVTRSMPATLRAAKVVKRLEEALKQKVDVQKEIAGAAEAVSAIKESKDAEKALGDALLKIAALCRGLKLDPEIALNAATDRMIQRFAEIEDQVLRGGESLEALAAETLSKYWDLVKLSDFGK